MTLSSTLQFCAKMEFWVTEPNLALCGNTLLFCYVRDRNQPQSIHPALSDPQSALAWFLGALVKFHCPQLNHLGSNLLYRWMRYQILALQRGPHESVSVQSFVMVYIQSTDLKRAVNRTLSEVAKGRLEQSRNEEDSPGSIAKTSGRSRAMISWRSRTSE